MRKYNLFVLILTLLLIFFIAITSIFILMYDILPYKYLIVYFALVIGIPIFLIHFMIKRRSKTIVKVICSFFMILLIAVLGFALYYLYNTFSFLDDFGSYTYVTRNYKVLVPYESEYQKLNDLDGKVLGYITFVNANYDNAIKNLNEKIKVTGKDYIDLVILEEAFSLEQADGFLTTDTYYDILVEEDVDFPSKYRIIYEFSIEEKVEKEVVKDVDVTKDTFNIFISGMDMPGSISSIARSDVNIVMSVNPKTHQILMIHIPRDYYVTFPGQENRDKLTHSGLLGTETTIKTIEDILKIDINYYFKVNFTSVEDIVNALGGVDVYSDYNFTAVDSYYYRKGYNHVNGKQALAFVRTRYVLEGGDRARGKNQEALIQAIIKKATTPAILLRYTSLLEALNDKFMTNMSTNKITDIIKMQIDKMPTWKITSMSLDGTDSENYTSVFPERKVYVMEPNEETITAAIKALEDVKSGKTLEDSYKENNGNVNNPFIVKPTPPKQDTEEEKKEEDDKKDEDKDKDETIDKNDDTKEEETTPNQNPNESTETTPSLEDKNSPTEDNENKNPNEGQEPTEDKTLEDNGLVPNN